MSLILDDDVWSHTDQWGETNLMPKAPWFKRLPIIRHFRYFLHVVLMNTHYGNWASVFGFGSPRAWEIAYLDAVWSGKA